MFIEQTDCSSFFTTIAEELENEKPIDYILRIVDKSGDKSTQRLDAEKMKKFLEKYNSEMCEEKNTLNDTQIVVQKMINNMLLLDGSSEFVLKSFMMISSTNPLIVHYHDGYLKVLKTNGEVNFVQTLIMIHQSSPTGKIKISPRRYRSIRFRAK